MQDSPAAIARRKKLRSQRMQPGSILSMTTVHHAPADFPEGQRHIALIALKDGTHVMGLLTAPGEIGQQVSPSLRHMRTNAEGLRTYDVAYEPLVQTGDRLPFRGYILALTGPSGVGKSSISQILNTVFADYVQPVRIVTTRQSSAQDNGEYEYVSLQEFHALHAEEKLAAATEIPSAAGDRWYAYRTESIEEIWRQGKTPVVITEMHLLQDLAKRFGRRSILSFGLLPPGKSKRAMLSQLLYRLRTRGRDSEASIRDRLANAKKDLLFFEERQDLFDHLIVNETLEQAVDIVKKHVLSRHSLNTTPQQKIV